MTFTDPIPGDQPDAPPSSGAVPRELRDPRELRALAHPIRIQLLEELATLGEATATQLGERIDQSPANCSWHLRQLAKYGFIEESEPRGRQRPWRWIPQAPNISEVDGDADQLRQARAGTVDVLRGRDLAAWRAWEAARDQTPASWRRASFGSTSINWLTAEELAALSEAIGAVIDEHLMARVDRFDPAARPDGAHLVRFGVWGFPSGHLDELQDPDHLQGPEEPT